MCNINKENITPLVRGRLEKILEKKYIFDWGIGTVQENIKRNKIISKQRRIEPSVKYNRTKYNRMSEEKQKEYEKKINTTKTTYYSIDRENNYQKVPKILFDSLDCEELNRKTLSNY